MPDTFASLSTLVSSLFSTRQDVHVHGVEISQTIQYFHSRLHLTDPAQQGADNSVRLVANKPALVRVYLRAGLRSFGAAKATVELLPARPLRFVPLGRDADGASARRDDGAHRSGLRDRAR